MGNCDKNSLKKIAAVSTLTSTASYISLVILALYINTYVSLVLTAVVIAIPSIIRAFSGFFLNNLAKIIKKENLFLLSLLLSSSCFFLYIIAKSFIIFLLIAIVSGISALVYQPIAKEFFSNSASDKESIGFVHRIRYLTICVAGLVGPVIGGFILHSCGYYMCFVLSGIISLIAIIPAYSLSTLKNCQSVSTKATLQLKPKVIKDRLLWGYILSGFLIYLVFSQFEAVYSLALDTTFQNPAEIYSVLLSLNSLFGILLQTLIMQKWFKLKKLSSVNMGVAFFQIGYALFALSFLAINTSFATLVAGVFIYSIGEVITIPQLDIQIDRFAPNELKSEYFSLAELRTLGFVLGPILMSAILKNCTAAFSCLINVVILLFAILINTITQKRYMQTQRREEKVQ